MESSFGQKITAVPNFLKYMRILKCWPQEGDEFQPPKKFYILYTILIVPSFLMIISQWLQVAVVISHGKSNIIEILTDITDASSITGCFLITLAFVFNTPKWAKIFWNFSQIQNTLSIPNQMNLKRYNLFTKLQFYYSSIGVVAIGLFRMIFDECSTNQMDDIRTCGLFNNTYLPFQYNFIPIRPILLILQLWGFGYIIKISATVAFSPLECTQHINVQIDEFKNKFQRHFAKLEHTNSWMEQFQELIQEHCAIIELQHECRKCYRPLLFVHFTMTTAIMGMCLFVITKTHSFSLAPHFIGWLIVLAVTCIASESLIEQSLDVGNMIFDQCQWYRASIRVQQDLQIMLIMAQRPLYLESCSISYFSLGLLLNMLRATYSFITLLQDITE